MIKILYAFLLSVIVLSSIQIAFAEDSEKPKFYKIIEPDIHIDFSDDSHWEGLSTNSDYWQIRDGEGYFMLYSKNQQLNSATYDLLPFLESEIGEDWILRYKLTLNNYEQGNNSKWSELLIGLHNESGNGLSNQWGIGIGFLNGANLKFTNLMYGYGTYNEWHCCPIKGQLQKESSLPGSDKTFWIEYTKGEKTLTVKLFDDENFENLIEQKSVSGWAINDIRFLKIFPLVEDSSVNGSMSGRIDDIKFYNHKTSVYVPDKAPIPESLKPKTMDEMLKEALGNDYVAPAPDEIYTSSIPPEFKKVVKTWAIGNMPDSEFYPILKSLVTDEKMLVEELSRAYGQKLDLTYKPQTITIPKDVNCSSCLVEDFVNIRWKIPDGLPENASAVVDIVSPSGDYTRLTTSSTSGVIFQITNESHPGLYEISVTYANKKFNISPLLLIDDDVPKLPFWVKYNSLKWANEELPEVEFVDSLIFLIQNGEITFNYDLFVKKESKIIAPEEALEEFFPTQNEIAEISPKVPPPIWEYLVTSDALRLVNMDFVSVQKILEDKTRLYDPIYGKYDVPFTMIQIYQFPSNEMAKEFIEEQIWTKNVLVEGTVSEDELAYNDYKYVRIFENSDMNGTSHTTGDCLYNLTQNSTDMMLDETHFLQCVLNEKIIQIYVSEDYSTVDESFSFELMDIILKKINNTSEIQTVKNVLTLNNLAVPQSASSPAPSSPAPSSPAPSSQSPNHNTDPEISGTTVGIHDFVCMKDDFGTITMNGNYVNGENSFEQVKINISIESYDGTILAYGSDYVFQVNPFEIRTIDGYVFVDKPFHKCNANIDWNSSK